MCSVFLQTLYTSYNYLFIYLYLILQVAQNELVVPNCSEGIQKRGNGDPADHIRSISIILSHLIDLFIYIFKSPRVTSSLVPTPSDPFQSSPLSQILTFTL